MPSLSPEQLLGLFDDLLRTMPNTSTSEAERFAWSGKALALLKLWDPSKAIIFDLAMNDFNSTMVKDTISGHRKILLAVQEARSDLTLKTLGPTSTAINQGKVFDYFDEIRKIIELAKTDIFFVDPYLNADFVSRFLPYINKGTRIRLLTHKYLDTLLPAVDAFKQQNGSIIEVRRTKTFHDRYIFVDEQACYQSGTSLKDGTQNAPTVITQIVDAFPAMQSTYESMWKAAENFSA